jgi:transcriptional regulator with XRE-family HTH domain
VAQRDGVFPKRLKAARERKDLSQRRLGILAGIHQDSASSRINQYEHGVHEPDYGTLERLAGVLDVPTAYLYAEDDLLAELILLLHAAPDNQKRKILRALQAEQKEK